MTPWRGGVVQGKTGAWEGTRLADRARETAPIGSEALHGSTLRDADRQGARDDAAKGRGLGGGLGDALVLARSALFTTLFYGLFVAMMIGGLPLLLAPRPVVVALARLWARLSLVLLRVTCGLRIEVRGQSHRPRGAAILAVKHQSFLETFALLAVLDDFSYVLKRELVAIPLFGWYLRRTGQIAIHRERRAGALPALQRAVAAVLDAGRCVVIFPEGTRRPVGAEPAYKPGVALLCRDGTVPCTPVALNTGLFWPRRSSKRYPGTVVIEFLPPVPTSLGKREFMKALQGAIEGASDALAAEAIAADPRLGDTA